MKNATIYIFGATGYVGRYLCLHMKSKAIDFIASGRTGHGADFLLKNNIPFVPFDLDGNSDVLDTFDIKEGDIVVNLAACLAEHEMPVKRFFDINTIGAYKLLEASKKAGASRYIMTSSHKVYNAVDCNDYGQLISEETPLRYGGPHTPYIISKIAAENFVNYYNNESDVCCTCLRLSGVRGYGEILGHLTKDGHYLKSAFEIFFEKAINGEQIEVWGDQRIKRDHVYIKDVINAIVAATKVNAPGIFNIASGVGHSQYEEAVALVKVFGNSDTSSIVLCPGKKGLSRGYVYDISKAKRELNWQPTFTELETMYIDYKEEWERKLFKNYHNINKCEAPLTI